MTLCCECGQCTTCVGRAYYRRNRERVLARRRAHYLKNREVMRAKQNAYYATEKGREVIKKSWSSYRERNKHKKAVRAVVANEIARGRLNRGECVRTGPDCIGGIEAHHEDYSRPLDIIWACRRHHDDLDYERLQRLREIGREAA